MGGSHSVDVYDYEQAVSLGYKQFMDKHLLTGCSVQYIFGQRILLIYSDAASDCLSPEAYPFDKPFSQANGYTFDETDVDMFDKFHKACFIDTWVLDRCRPRDP